MTYKYMKLTDQFLHITHNDSDALGCALVIDYYKEEVCYLNNRAGYIPVHNFNSVDSAQRTIDFLIKILTMLHWSNTHPDIESTIDDNELTKFKKLTWGKDYIDNGVICIPSDIFITDVSIGEDQLIKLNDIATKMDINLLYVDHHASSLKNHQIYDWCYIKSTDDNNIPRSACKYLFDILVNRSLSSNIISNFNAFYTLINHISRYDTWLWKTDPDELNENWTQIIIDGLGDIHDAYERIKKKVFGGYLMKNLCDIDFFNTIISINETKKSNCINKYIKNVVYDTGHNLGFVNTEYASANYALIILPENFGNDIMEEIYNSTDNPVDIVIGIYPSTRTLSFRRSVSCTIDLSRLAAIYGGGGHVTASGAKLGISEFILFLNHYYKLYDQKLNKNIQ